MDLMYFNRTNFIAKKFYIHIYLYMTYYYREK